MSSAINSKTYIERHIQFSDLDEVEESERLGIIQTINSSLEDSIWDNDTYFINKTYLHFPSNYQTFQIAKLFHKAIGYVIIREHETR